MVECYFKLDKEKVGLESTIDGMKLAEIRNC